MAQGANPVKEVNCRVIRLMIGLGEFRHATPGVGFDITLHRIMISISIEDLAPINI